MVRWMGSARAARALGVVRVFGVVTGVALLTAAPAVLLAGCGSTNDGSAGAGAASGSASASPIVVPDASSSASDVVKQAPVQHVKVGDLEMGYRTIGPFGAAADSTPLLMIMGSSGTMDMWSPGVRERPRAGARSGRVRQPGDG